MNEPILGNLPQLQPDQHPYQMASNCNNHMENNTGSSSAPYHPDDAMPVSPFDAIPTQITPAALLTIPFISILIGVSALHPTKPVYTIYPPIPHPLNSCTATER